MADIDLKLNLTFCTAIMGLFMTVPMFVMARSRPANLWLGLFVYALSSLCFADLYQRHPELYGLFDWPLAGLGTFFYMYVRSMIGLGVGRRQAWHVVPLLLFCGLLLWMRLTMPLDGPRGGSSPTMRMVFGLSLLACQLLCFFYGFATIYLLHRHRRRVRENFSSAENRDLRWLTALSSAILLLLLIWVPATLLRGAFLWSLLFGRLALLFFVGWFGLRSLPVFMPQLDRAPAAPEPAPETEKYARSGMTEAASELIGERLVRRVAHHRDYLVNDLTLAELAERIGATPQLLSQYLNHVLGLNFFDYVNGLRVAEVQRKMLESEHAGATLLDLALACGFNSKSTFNASFKRVTGMAPSAWRAGQARSPAAAPA